MEVQLQAAFVTAGAVLLGLAVQTTLALRTLGQRRRSDDRDARWDRIQWAVDHTLTGDAAAQEVGAAALERLVDEAELDDRDRDVVRAALEELAARQEDALDAALALRSAAEGAHDPPGGDGQEGRGP